MSNTVKTGHKFRIKTPIEFIFVVSLFQALQLSSWWLSHVLFIYVEPSNELFYILS